MDATHTTDHATLKARARKMTDAQLRWTANDCREAYEANPANPKCGEYRDMELYCAEELARRTKVEAYGVKGTASKPWRKTFANQKAFEKWLDKNAGDVEVHGTREL